MLKRLLLRLTLRLLDKSFQVDYKKIDKKAVEEWAYKSFDDPGFRSYLAYEDMKILKELSFGKDPDVYHILIGRRLQLLYMADEMKKAVANKKSAQEKQNAISQKAEETK